MKPALLLLLLSTTPLFAQFPAGYKGKPWLKQPQPVPGRVELAYYDRGGEGVAYHDTTPENEGAKLNRTDGHHRPGIPASIAFFRENEGVDISYTKDWADFNHPNPVDPAVNQRYIGWESDGEWTNYTIDVKTPGRYKIITVYGNRDNKSWLAVNGTKACDLVLPRDTGNWHIWDQATIGEITFEKAGKTLLTLHYNSGANLAYLDFVLLEQK
jgi:hypothetical protein